MKTDKVVSWLEVTRQSGLAKLLFLFLLLFMVFYRPWTGIQPNLSKTRESEVLRIALTIIRRRIHEADISTPVAVDQRAANCRKEAVRSFTAMRSRCRSSHADVTFHRPQTVFPVIRCSSVHCFQTLITVELFRCTRAPIAR
ncbi:uncharacterized protein TNCV_5104101 [Trichonephila clavipes]|nr:uncharacterized protein TNCV_5104101 [Trichonephila clavipes]